jgi:ribonuclease HI
MYFDGSKRVQGAGAGVVLISPHGNKLKYVLRMSFSQASNNEAEYEALLHGMKMAKACRATRLKIFGDSNLIVQQVMNSRNSNEEADNLANIGSQCLPVPSGVFWDEIVERSIKSVKSSTTAAGSGATPEPKEVMMIEETWMQPYLAYMINKQLLEDAVEAKRITQ